MYFIAVVDEGSISGAASRLHMTQPPLSQAVLALEREIGATLLRRHPRGVEPTPAGLLLVEQGKNLLRWSDRITEEVARLGSGESGRLTVASVPTFAWSNLPALLQDFGAAAPGVEVQLSDPSPEGVLQMVVNGTADIGFVSTSDPSALEATRPDLLVHSLLPLPLSLAVAQIDGRPVESGSTQRVQVRDYADTTWFIPEEVPGFPGLTETMHNLWRDAGFYPRSVRYVSTLQTSLPLIVAGMGVTLLPGSLTGPASTGISVCEMDIAVPPLFATTLRARHIEPSLTLRRFLDVVANHFGRYTQDV